MGIPDESDSADGMGGTAASAIEAMGTADVRVRLPGLHDLLVKALGLRAGFDLKFALQRIPTNVVLADGLIGVTMGGIGPHERAVRILAHRIESDQTLGRRDAFGAGELCRQLVQHRDRHVAQPRTLEGQPLLEGRIADGKSIHKIPGVERCSLTQVVDLGGCRQPLELDDIDRESRRVATQRVRIYDQRLRIDPIEIAPKSAQRLPQAAAGLSVSAVAPQQIGEFLAG